LTRRVVVGALSAVLALGAWIAIRDVRRGYWTTRGAAVSRFTLHSRLVQRDLHEIRVVPKRHSDVTLVLLHGRGSTPSSWLNQGFFNALASLGARAPQVLLLDGGDHSYWHDRADGKWASMVLQEAVPKHGRVAIGGISMGGYGALLLGARGRFCAVGGHSPALWFHAGDTPAGAFDDAADYARNDIVGHAPRYRAPVWIDVGTDDPFRDAAVAYAKKIHAQLHVWPGGHDHAYWSAHMRQYLSFYARACG
jgi:S-formylglutathione hydrolase FrmB